MDYAETVENAVKQFYAAGANEAHSWLLQVQASPEAWTFVWQLLDPSKPWEVQFFAATTLHTKISKQWDEVPKSEYPALQERVLNSMRQPNTPKLVLSRLCQALAAFMANSYTELEERDKSLAEELIEVLPYSNPSSLDLLLRVLSVLPGEFERRQGVRRIKLRESLINSWYKTTWLLQQVFSMFAHQIPPTNSNALYILALECTLSWLKIGQLPLETTGQIYPHLLVAAARYAPSREGVEEECIRGWEVVQECLTMSVTHCELHKRPQMLWQWAKDLVTMARQQSGTYFCEILTALGEAHSRAFLIALIENNEEQKWTSENLIELLLQCSELEGRYPTEERRSCIPFGFWYALQDDLGTLDEPFESKATAVLKHIYDRLARALLRKATLPESPSEAGDADERELLRCYRQDVADTLVYCYNVLRTDFLVLLGMRLTESTRSVKWTEIESYVHAFRAVAEVVGTKENHYVPALMNIIVSDVQYNDFPPELLASACSAIGAYSEWIGEHPNPWLEKSMKIIAFGLVQCSVTASPASMALKDIARECGSHLAPFAPAILYTISEILPTLSPGAREGLRLMFAAGKLLNSLSSREEQLEHLNRTMGFCVMNLRRLLEDPISTARVSVTNQLKMITMFLSTLEGSIGKSILDGLLPIFNGIVEHPEWSQDESTLNAMHSCAQRSLSSLLHPEVDALPLLPILSASYKKRPHPAALNVLRQLVLLFGRDPNNVISPIFAELSSITLGGVNVCRSVGGNLSELSDLLESYLCLLAQICKKNARMLLQIPDQVPDMLRCGIACLTLPETATCRAAGSFLTHAILQSPHLQTFIQPIGQELVCVLLQCIGGKVPRTCLEPHAEVLLTLNKTCIEWTAQWLRLGLADETGPDATQAQKDIFTRNVLRERTNKRRLCEILKDFSLQCRQPTVGL